MVQTALKRLFRPAGDVSSRPVDAAKTFVAGGSVGKLHERLRDELGLDWDDPIAGQEK